MILLYKINKYTQHNYTLLLYTLIDALALGPITIKTIN